ncbi:MAG: DUF192 domain-containing protein [Nitrososphaera sp.]|uniref:DUF192 domain-containing protein n=1 Tax=Nitrososphaera sp. TaxID=1971748 RepID=UPI003D6E2EC2
MRTIVAVAIAGGIAAAAALLSVLLFTPIFSVGGPEPNSPIVRAGGLPGYNQTVVSIGDVRLLADIAADPNQKSLGLGVRNNMTEAEGMLFPFESEAPHGFWMNGMKFPIDIIWLDAGKKVVHIEPDLKPCPSVLDCPNYTPDRNSMYVLETVAGFSERHNVTVGTQAEFELS